jgi:putative membrane protein
MGWLLAVLLVVMCWPVLRSMYDWWLAPSILSAVWMGLMLSLMLLIGSWLMRQWLSVRAIRQRQNDAAATLAVAHHDAKTMVSHCQDIARSIGATPEVIAQWQGTIEPHHSAEEVLVIFENELLKPVDKATHKLIYRWSSEAAAMVALSPYASLDMLLVLWRNSRMLKQIAAQYGLAPSMVAQLYLIRLVLLNIAFAGVSQVVTDLGLETLGTEFASRLSARVAQGISAGLFSARIGYKCLQLCRPIPLRVDETPREQSLREQLARDLNSLDGC